MTSPPAVLLKELGTLDKIKVIGSIYVNPDVAVGVLVGNFIDKLLLVSNSIR
ncbi:hypothetical protein D3C81_2253780 [compost metagenome]